MVFGTHKSASWNVTDKCLGAPETFRPHVDTESAHLRITPAVDIYSIGCVLSEVSVWATYGWKRVVEYRRQRSKEIVRRGLGQGEYVFHFEGKILDTVHNIHKQILGDCTVRTCMTRSVVAYLVKGMLLLKPANRPPAQVFLGRAKRMIEACEKEFGTRLEGNANGEPIDEVGLMAKFRDPVLPEFSSTTSQLGGHNRLPAERGPLLSGPIPPGDDFAPSSSSSRSPSQHYHHSKTQRNEPHSVVATTEPLQPSKESSHVVPNPPPAPSTAANVYESSERQHSRRRQEEPVRLTLTIEQGLRWKKLKKLDRKVYLPGACENLISLDQRDHVSHALSSLNPTNRSL